MAERERDYAEFDHAGETEAVATGAHPTEVGSRRGPDPWALVVGVLTLAVAVAAFTGWVPELPHFDPRWMLAAGAAAVGVLLLLGSVRRR